MKRYCLWRILGNDLPPRHSETQTETNLNFILNNEIDFRDCDKRFVLNRILDKDKEFRYVKLIEAAGYSYDILPFIDDTYRQNQTIQDKLNYLTNVNPARNYCVRRGFELGYDYILPFDGASCFRKDGWEIFDSNCRFNDGDGYFVLGQSRPEDFQAFLHKLPILKENYSIDGKRYIASREFAVAFGRDWDQLFDEDYTLYGKADKVDLLWKLGIPGVWDRWYPKLKARALENLSEWAGKIKMAGWVARLPSGNPEADKDSSIRGRLRAEGLNNLVLQANRIK